MKFCSEVSIFFPPNRWHHLQFPSLRFRKPLCYYCLALRRNWSLWTKSSVHTRDMVGKPICRLTVMPLMRKAFSSVTRIPTFIITPSSSHALRNSFCTSSVPKQETPVTPISPTRPEEYAPLIPITKVESEEELQDEWKSLERRVASRKTRVNDGSTPTGRGKRNSSAWDAENNEVQWTSDCCFYSILLLAIPDKLLKSPIIIEEVKIYLRIVTLSNCDTNLHSTWMMIVDMIHEEEHFSTASSTVRSQQRRNSEAAEIALCHYTII